jgi:hypothetical protein
MVMTGIVGMVATLLYLAIRAYTRSSTDARPISVLLRSWALIPHAANSSGGLRKRCCSASLSLLFPY